MDDLDPLILGRRPGLSRKGKDGWSPRREEEAYLERVGPSLFVERRLHPSSAIAGRTPDQRRARAPVMEEVSNARRGLRRGLRGIE